MAKLPELWVGFAYYEDGFEGEEPCFAKAATLLDCRRKLTRQIDRRCANTSGAWDKWLDEYRRVQ